MKYLTMLIVGNIVGGYLTYNYVMPKIMEKRMTDLSLLRYDSKLDNMVAKDSVNLKSGDLIYILYGNTK